MLACCTAPTLSLLQRAGVSPPCGGRQAWQPNSWLRTGCAHGVSLPRHGQCCRAAGRGTLAGTQRSCVVLALRQQYPMSTAPWITLVVNMQSFVCWSLWSLRCFEQTACTGLRSITMASASCSTGCAHRCQRTCSCSINHLQVSTMPPVPAHCRAWRGTPILLEVQRDGAARLRLMSHDNEYVGLLRERLARQMGCSAKSVRMFSMGECRQQAQPCG